MSFFWKYKVNIRRDRETRLILVLNVNATSYTTHSLSCTFSLVSGGHRGRDSMVVGFITTHETSAYHHYRFE
jgi:hypothetical protein